MVNLPWLDRNGARNDTLSERLFKSNLRIIFDLNILLA